MRRAATKPVGAAGRVLVPADIRAAAGLRPGTAVEIALGRGGVVTLRAVRALGQCVLCGASTRRTLAGRPVCAGCLALAREAGRLNGRTG